MTHAYRIYILDSQNHISVGHDFEGSDDPAAIKQAELLSKGNAVEVWYRARLVANKGSKTG
jgi:hypothetical protein